MTTEKLVVFEDAEAVKLTDEQKETLVREACQEKCRFHWAMTPYRQKAMEVRQLYLDTMPQPIAYDNPDDSYEVTSRLKRPVMAEAVDSINAQLVQSMFPADERFFKGKARNRAARELLPVYEAHVEQRLTDIDFLAKETKDLINCLLDGVSAVACPAIRKEKQRSRYKPIFSAFGINFGRVKEKETEIVLEGTDYIPLMFTDWWIDPTMDSFDDTPFIWRRWMKVDEVKSMKNWKNTKDIQPFKAAYDEAESDKRLNYEYMGIQFDSTLDPNNSLETAMGESHVLVYERWGDFWVNGKFYPNHVLVWSNDMVFHHFGPNEYDHGEKPFVVGPYIPVPGTLLGKSLGWDIIPLCHAMNTLLNMVMDILSAEADPSYTAMSNDDVLWASIGEGKIPVGNGKYILVKSHESLKPLTKDLQGLNIIYQLMQILKEEIREMTGGVPYATGAVTEEAGEKTLGEVQILAAGTSTRLQARIKDQENNKLKRFLDMNFENDRQFMTEPVLVDGFDDPLMPDDVKDMDVVLQVTGSKSVMNKQRDQQAFTNLAFNLIPQGIKAGFIVLKKDVHEADGYALMKEAARQSGVNLDDYTEKMEMPEEGQMDLEDPAVLAQLQQQGGLSGLSYLPSAPGRGSAIDLGRTA